MRYVELVIRADDGGLHPIDTALAEARDVYRERIHQINLLDDGTAVALYGIGGELRRARSILASQPSVLVADVIGDRSGVAYIYFRPNETVRSLLTVVREYEFVLQFPIQPLESGGVRVTLVGHDELFQHAVENLPDELVISLQKIGDYEGPSRNALSVLTDRQLETIIAAYEQGYYTSPREATHESIAEEIDRSARTVGEHLRTAENRLVNLLLGQIGSFEDSSSIDEPVK